MKFDHKYHKMINWAKEKFRKDDHYTQWLESQHSWIKRIRLRNALEHPTDLARGRLHIQNVQFAFTRWGSGECCFGSCPVRHPHDLIDAQNMNVKVQSNSPGHTGCNLGELFPEIPITFRVIPEEQRDPKCAVRLEPYREDFFMTPNTACTRLVDSARFQAVCAA